MRSKSALALEMVRAARARGMRFAWVGFDGGYGKEPAFLRALEAGGPACGLKIEFHHLAGRSASVKNHPLNRMALCAEHHRLSTTLSAHGAPKAFKAWLEANRPEQYAFAFTKAGRDFAGEGSKK